MSLLSFSSSLQLSAYGAELSSEACRDLGFSSNLLCSSCDLLGELSLTKLEPSCRRCCQQEAQMEARKVKEMTEVTVLATGSNCLSRFCHSEGLVSRILSNEIQFE